MTSFLLDHSLLALLSFALTASILYFAHNKLQEYRRHAVVIQENGCKPAEYVFPLKDKVLGIDYMIDMISHAKQKKLLQFHVDMLKIHPTITFNALFKRDVITADSENIKAMLAIKFNDWEVEPARKLVKPLLGEGIFTMYVRH
jgi:hypothetical protein